MTKCFEDNLRVKKCSGVKSFVLETLRIDPLKSSYLQKTVIMEDPEGMTAKGTLKGPFRNDQEEACP